MQIVFSLTELVLKQRRLMQLQGIFCLINPCLYVFTTRNAECMKYFNFTIVSSITPFFVMHEEVRSSHF